MDKAKIKADKRAAALKANMQRRKAFVKGQKELKQEDEKNAKSESNQ